MAHTVMRINAAYSAANSQRQETEPRVVFSLSNPP